MDLYENPFETNAAEYDRWYEENTGILKMELAAVRCLMNKAKRTYRSDPGRHRSAEIPVAEGLEVGVGSGRFAKALGIRTGIDPSPSMLALASARGIRVFTAQAEKLPFPDGSFDFTAFFTSICFLTDPLASFREANRVTREGGFLICSFLNRDSQAGRYLSDHKSENVYYRNATFYSGEEVKDLLKKAGYGVFSARETVFTDSEDKKGAEGPAEQKKRSEKQTRGPCLYREGLGEGLYGVILAWKKKTAS